MRRTVFVISMVEYALDTLRVDTDGRYRTPKQICPICQKPKPPAAKRCQKCSYDDLDPVYCDADSRIREFLHGLGSRGIWPLSRNIESSASELMKKVDALVLWAHCDHDCTANDTCPLVAAVCDMRNRAKASMAVCHGLELRDYKQSPTLLDDTV